MNRWVAAAVALLSSAPLWPDARAAATEPMEYLTPGFLDGLQLHEMAALSQTGFVMYVAGVHDSLKRDLAFCAPREATMLEAGEVVVKYLSNHIHTRDRQAHLIVREALVDKWPCPRPRETGNVNR